MAIRSSKILRKLRPGKCPKSTLGGKAKRTADGTYLNCLDLVMKQDSSVLLHSVPFFKVNVIVHKKASIYAQERICKQTGKSIYE